MGCCRSSDLNIAYPYEFPLTIERTFAIDRERTGAKLAISLNNPQESRGAVVEVIPGMQAKVSGCLIPGFNARLKKDLVCKDRFYFSHSGSPFFGFVLDGHGEKGREAAAHCHQFLIDFYTTNTAQFEASPTDALKKMIAQCHEELQDVARREDDYVPRKSGGKVSDWQFTGV